MRPEEIALKENEKYLKLFAQSISEVFFNVRDALERRSLQNEYEKADHSQKFQMEFNDMPEKFTFITVDIGDEEEFKRILEKKDIDYLYVDDPTRAGGGFIVRRRDARRIEGPLLDIEKSEEEQSLEEEEDPEYGEELEEDREEDREEDKEDDPDKDDGSDNGDREDADKSDKDNKSDKDDKGDKDDKDDKDDRDKDDEERDLGSDEDRDEPSSENEEKEDEEEKDENDLDQNDPDRDEPGQESPEEPDTAQTEEYYDQNEPESITEDSETYEEPLEETVYETEVQQDDYAQEEVHEDGYDQNDYIEPEQTTEETYNQSTDIIDDDYTQNDQNEYDESHTDSYNAESSYETETPEIDTYEDSHDNYIEDSSVSSDVSDQNASSSDHYDNGPAEENQNSYDSSYDEPAKETYTDESYHDYSDEGAGSSYTSEEAYSSYEDTPSQPDYTSYENNNPSTAQTETSYNEPHNEPSDQSLQPVEQPSQENVVAGSPDTQQQDFNFVLSQDDIIGRADERTHDSFNNAVVEIVKPADTGVDDTVLNKGVKETMTELQTAAEFFNSLPSSKEGAAIDFQTALLNDKENGLTTMEAGALNAMLEGKFGKGNGLNFTTPEEANETAKRIHRLMVDAKLVEDRSIPKHRFTTQIDRDKVVRAPKIEGLKSEKGKVTAGAYSVAYMSKLARKSGVSSATSASITNKLYSNSSNLEAARQQLLKARDGVKNLANPFKSGIARRATKDDATANAINQGLATGQKVKMIGDAASHIKGIRLMKKQSKLSDKNLKLAKKLQDADPAKKASLQKKYERFKKKENKVTDKIKKRTERIDNKGALKKRAKEKLKKFAGNQLKKTPVGRLALNAHSRYTGLKKAALKKVADSRMFSAMRGVSEWANKLKEKIFKKILGIIIKAAPFLFKLLFIMFLLCFLAQIEALIVAFFTGEDPGYFEDPDEIYNSTVGLVYGELMYEEGMWGRYLTHVMFNGMGATPNDTYGDESKELLCLDQEAENSVEFTHFFDSGDVDLENMNEESYEYIPEFVEFATDFDEGDNAAKGPEPWVGAPGAEYHRMPDPDDDNAYKWIKIIDGGIDVMFRGVAGRYDGGSRYTEAAGFMSNVREIVSMQSVAQYQSDRQGNDGYGDGEDPGGFIGFLSDVYTFAKGCLNWVKNKFEYLKLALMDLVSSGWAKQYATQKQANAAMVYAKPVFDQSHREVYSLSLALHRTEKISEDDWKLTDWYTIWDWEERDDASSYRDDDGEELWEMCSGNESQKTKFSPEEEDEHHGYGCMSYSGFSFKYDSDEEVYYDDEIPVMVSNGVELKVVTPAAKVPNGEIDEYKDTCVAPGDWGERWLQIMAKKDPSEYDGQSITVDYEDVMHLIKGGFGHSDCWKLSGISDIQHDESEHELEPSISAINEAAGYPMGIGLEGYGFPHSDNEGETYTIRLYLEDAKYDNEGNLVSESDYIDVSFRHNCQDEHTGYYCGGHFKLITTGLLYHMTIPQKKHFHHLYEEPENGNRQLGDYVVNPLNTDEVSFSEVYMEEAADIFDVDSAIVHGRGWVDEMFEGWIYDTIDCASDKLYEDWESVYEIFVTKDDWKYDGNGKLKTYGLFNVAETIGDAEAQQLVDYQGLLYGDSPIWEQRKQALLLAMGHVGDIGYSQKHHADPLRSGGLTDCSGFVSGAWYGYIQEYNTTIMFSTIACNNNILHPYSDGGVKPGDIMVLVPGGEGANHTILYAGIDPRIGEPAILECTGHGARYRIAHERELASYSYIDMDGWPAP